MIRSRERIFRLRRQTDCGYPESETTSGIVAEVSHPSKRRCVMRIDF